MDIANRFEAHYYLTNPGHRIDAVVRNKCEAELLAILYESAALLDIDVSLVAEAYREGGFRDIWKLLGESAPALTVLVIIVQLIVTAVPLFDDENSDLEKELNRLSIEEKRLQIEKLKKELKKGEDNSETVEKAATVVGSSLKVIKRKSNFYSQLEKYPYVSKVGFVPLNDNFIPISEEKQVKRSEFSKFVLTTNKLRSEEDDGAVIEIISPVLKEGRYKWKGVYNEKPINFEMQDSAFRDAVLLENIPFRHGTRIACVLIIHRELDEVGEVKIKGYSVSTVLQKIDGEQSFETMQGKKYRHAKRMAENQGELFDESSNKSSKKDALAHASS